MHSCHVWERGGEWHCSPMGPQRFSHYAKSHGASRCVRGPRLAVESMMLIEATGSCNASIASLACDHQTQSIAVGTDYTNHQASIIIWYVVSALYDQTVRPTELLQGCSIHGQSQSPVQRGSQRRRDRGRKPAPGLPDRLPTARLKNCQVELPSGSWPYPTIRLNGRSRKHMRYHYLR